MAPHSSTLAWKIPWTEEPGRLQSMGLLRVRHDWRTSLSLFTFMHWRRKWQPTPVFLPGESQGRGSLVACRLRGCTESDTTEVTQQQQQQAVGKLKIKESHCGWWSKNKRKFWWNNPRGERRNHIMRYLYDRLYRFWIVFHMLKDKLRHSKMFQFSSVAQSCPTLCDPMNRSTPGLSVHHQLLEFIQTHVHQVSDAIQTSHPLSSPSPPAPNPSQHQSLFQWVNS